MKAPPPGAGRPSAATPPSGYRCGPGGKLVLNKGCTCAAGRKETRDADDVAVCVKTTATRPPPDERRPPTPGPGPGPLPTPKPGPLPTPGELRVSIGQMTGDPGGYTEAEIMRVVRARVGTVRACYQKELTRAPGLQGKLIVKLKIADGKVAAASATSSTLANAAIESCVRFNFQRLVFPAKTAGADVAIPIVFTST